METLRLVAGVAIIIALMFNIIALFTSAWIVSTNVSSGLFWTVTKIGTIERPKTTAEKVAISFNIMSDVTMLCAAVFILMANKKGRLLLIGGSIAILSAAFILIEMATYTGLYRPSVDGTDGGVFWGYSFAFGWTAFSLATISGVFALVGKCLYENSHDAHSYTDLD